MRKRERERILKKKTKKTYSVLNTPSSNFLFKKQAINKQAIKIQTLM